MKRYKSTTLYKEERIWFFAAIALLLFVFALYTYFVSASVVQVVIRKEIEEESMRMESHVSQLEAEYIEVQHAVSADIASMHGYTVATEKTFIDRTNTTLVLGVANDS